MEYAEALSMRPKGTKKPKAELREMVMRKSDNGGVVVEHRMSGPMEGHEPMHTFAAHEGPKLAEHIGKHMGIQIHGNHADAADPEETEE